MNRLIVNALNLGIAASLAMGTVACNRDASADVGSPGNASALSGDAAAQQGAQADAGPKYARVVSVDPVRQSGDPKRECHDEVVSRTAPPRDQHQIAGTAIGAVAGGLLGNQIGHGNGRTLATVAGAIGGGYAGHRIQEDHQHGTVYNSTVRRCETVKSGSSQVVAYDVKYEYNGVTRTVRMDHDPGDRLEVKEGVVAVSDAR